MPFRGSGPAVAGLVGGHVSMMFAGLPSVIGNIKNGLVRPLAIDQRQALRLLPDLPTVAEAGFPGFEAAQRYGLIAPAGTPPAIIAKLNAALHEALTSDEVKARIATEGADPIPGTPRGLRQGHRQRGHEVERRRAEGRHPDELSAIEGELQPRDLRHHLGHEQLQRAHARRRATWCRGTDR